MRDRQEDERQTGRKEGRKDREKSDGEEESNGPSVFQLSDRMWRYFLSGGVILTADMSTGGVHRGFLRKYGGFKLFRQWKERYLVLTVEGCLRVCRDAESPPDQVVALQWNCEAIIEGREILDLPRLPPGGRRDCCFALILPQDKFLLLLADSPEDCNLWLKLIRKVREGVMLAALMQRKLSLPPTLTSTLTSTLTPTRTAHITDREPRTDAPSNKDPATPRLTVGNSTPTVTPTPTPSGTPNTTPSTSRTGSFRDNTMASGHRSSVRSMRSTVSIPPPHRTSDCLRHGNSSDARAVRAVCLLMGGAAASSTLGYIQACSPASPLISRPPGLDPPLGHAAVTGGFSELGPGTGGSYHCSQDVDNPTHFNSFDFEGGDSDFDAFDCGGFVF
ncbi:hypothetical protein DPEC_G00297050 [Dallia pectoralis]|uniref:Uncharacterized protein n=1 Tax=Dallia pectoralis TaxID=75939 RepID=A0ACC2FFN0_DALPE|nr:hypothetical protein DPEC_G00297050 [Dallia pectoralis]